MPFSWQHSCDMWWSYLWQNTSRYAFFAVLTWALLWVVMRGPLRGRKIRALSPSARQMVMEFAISMRSIALFATAAAGMSLMSRAGFYPLTHLSHHWGPAWMAVSLVLMIVGHDAYYYWTHRALHRPALFRGAHARHHKSHNPSPFSAYSFDLGEAAVMVTFVVLWPLAVPTPWPVITLFILHQIWRNTLAHSGYELAPAGADGRPMFDWLTTATHHDMHHSHAGWNFGLYFTWWDRWMGTEHPDYYAAFAKSATRRVRPDAAAAAGPALG